MSKTLDVLIKVAERKVEEMQQNLAKTRDALMQLAQGIVKLEQDAKIAFMQAVGEDDILSLQVAGAYQERVRREIEALRGLEVGLKEQEAQQQQELQALYAQQKTYELLLEKQKLALKKERAKKVQNNLDEVAGRIR
ncbi:MAG: hypothetical protein DI585_02985 [Pseudomonas fluorescens]|nr:MAG: hypothetical protein DI585_02985 [Pseudomonas fluorescens]